MNLNELKRNESKLRRRLGDDQYEKIYTAQQRIEALRGKAANKRQGAGGDTDNMFYTNRPDSGTITNIPSIADYRKGIEDISAKIESLNKQQYEHMLSGDNSKVNALDNVIKNAEKQRDALRKQMTEAMGLGEESKEKDMLRVPSQKIGTEMEGLQGDSIRPLSSKSSGSAEVGIWKLIFPAQQDQMKTPGLMYPAEPRESTKEEPKPDPLTENNVYVSEEEYNSFLAELDKELDNRYATDGPVVTPINIDMKKTTLEQNRELSRQTEGTQGMYESEKDAAVTFAETAVSETGKDWLERGAIIIIGREVPVITSDGKIIMKKRYELGDEFVGEHDDVVDELLSAYGGAIDNMITEGVTVSFVHTHPYCTGHENNKFSGTKGNDMGNIFNEFMDRLVGKKSFKDFANYLGDKQVTWLPGVDKIYLASPTKNSLYACDENGPIMDPKKPEEYAVFGTFNAFAPNELQE